MSAKIIQVIEVTGTRGRGITLDPIRVVREYFTLEGELLAEHDGWIAGELAVGRGPLHYQDAENRP